MAIDYVARKGEAALFGSSGIRQIMSRELIELTLGLGLVVGKTYGNVIVGSDTRTSSDALKHAMAAGLLAAGAKCADAGVVSTPTLALAARRFDAGVMITASHNPAEYNGIKLFNPDGSAFEADQRDQIEEAILNDSLGVAAWMEVKSCQAYEGAAIQHIERILQDFPDKLRLRVVVDCGCGAASHMTPLLLSKMGCELATLNCYASGLFPRNPEPTENSLQTLIGVVRELGADLGIAHDGDADRLMVVDNRGRFVSGDKLLAIFASDLDSHDVITTVDASMSIEELGFKVTRTRVGDIHVSAELKKHGDFGGEPSGSWIFPSVSFCPDGIYAAARIAQITARQKLSEILDKIPGYPIERGSINLNGSSLGSLEPGLMGLKPLLVSRTDGIKLSFDDGWLLIRASGTEPKIRVTAEAKNEARARQLYEDCLKIICEQSS